ncbi:MAG: glycosyltransferase [Methylotenera sp.]|nr:glycosyltransferase [Oligoflexia bacterium]
MENSRENLRLSLIIPVRNRPREVSFLLESLVAQSHKDFEVLLIEDGSRETSEAVYSKYRSQLKLAYLVQRHSGPGPARNLGASLARGTHFLFLETDCRLPADLIARYLHWMTENPGFIFAGPPALGKNSRAFAKALHWVETQSRHRNPLELETFNLCIPAPDFHGLGGFRFLSPGEGIDLGIRARARGAEIRVLPELAIERPPARNLITFFTQSFQFGRARAVLQHWHPGSTKLSHRVPAAVLLYSAFLLFLFISILLGGGFSVALLCLLALPAGILLGRVAMQCFEATQDAHVTRLAVLATSVQLSGYGLGYLTESLLWGVRKIKAEETLPQRD